MTVSLVTRTAALRDSLVELHKTSSNVVEANHLEGLRLEIAQRTDRLTANLKTQSLLEDAKIAVPIPASLTAVRKRAKGLLEKFLADIKASTLKKGQGWTTLQAEIDAASRDLETAVRSAWRAHRQIVFAGDTPAAISGKLARTASNDKALETYQELYVPFAAAFEAPPASAADIGAVGKLALQLEKAAQKFDFDVPAEVKSFLEAVLSTAGAPIKLLTPGVRQWLEANGSIESYSIRSTGRK